jgi:hypothetical protein
MPGRWRYYLYEAHAIDGAGATAPAQRIGELGLQGDGVRNRQLTHGIRKASTATFSADRNEPISQHLHRTKDVLLVVRDGHAGADPSADPLFVGPIITAEKQGDAIACTAIDGWWRLMKRIIGVAAADMGKAGATDGPAFTGWSGGFDDAPKSLGIRWMVALANLINAVADNDAVLNFEYGGGTFSGVAPPAAMIGAFPGEGTLARLGPYAGRPVTDIVQEISGNLDAPEWVIDPVLPRLWDPADVDSDDDFLSSGGLLDYPSPRPTILLGRMRLGFPLGGVVRENARFELGVGRANVSDYRRLTDANGVANWIMDPASDATGVTVARKTGETIPGDPAYNALAVDLMEQISSGLEVVPLRQQLIEEHLQIRRQAREIITFNPLSDLTGAPAYGVDYDLGDIVPFHAVHNGREEINAYFRVYGVNRSLSDDDELVDAPVLLADS